MSDEEKKETPDPFGLGALARLAAAMEGRDIASAPGSGLSAAAEAVAAMALRGHARGYDPAGDAAAAVATLARLAPLPPPTVEDLLRASFSATCAALGTAAARGTMQTAASDAARNVVAALYSPATTRSIVEALQPPVSIARALGFAAPPRSVFADLLAREDARYEHLRAALTNALRRTNEERNDDSSCSRILELDTVA